MKWNSLLLLLLLFVVDGVWWLCGYEWEKKISRKFNLFKHSFINYYFSAEWIKMEWKTPQKIQRYFCQAGNFPEKMMITENSLNEFSWQKKNKQKKIHSQLIFVARMKRKKKIKIQVSKQNVKKCENETGNKIWHLWKCFWLWIWYIPTNTHTHTLNMS